MLGGGRLHAGLESQRLLGEMSSTVWRVAGEVCTNALVPVFGSLRRRGSVKLALTGCCVGVCGARKRRLGREDSAKA